MGLAVKNHFQHYFVCSISGWKPSVSKADFFKKGFNLPHVTVAAGIPSIYEPIHTGNTELSNQKVKFPNHRRKQPLALIYR